MRTGDLRKRRLHVSVFNNVPAFPLGDPRRCQAGPLKSNVSKRICKHVHLFTYHDSVRPKAFPTHDTPEHTQLCHPVASRHALTCTECKSSVSFSVVPFPLFFQFSVSLLPLYPTASPFKLNCVKFLDQFLRSCT